MKSYSILSAYYDALFVDEENVEKWADFTERHAEKGRILELAAGSGAISEALVKRGFALTLSDLSTDMLLEAEKKFGNALEYHVLDMRDFRVSEPYDTVICYNDSLNYLTEDEELTQCFSCVNQALKTGGVFLFDMHSTLRLEEFSEEYIEEGEVADAQYQWTIEAEDDMLCHHITFWKENDVFSEEHIQRIYSLDTITEMLEKSGFSCQIYGDFDQKDLTEAEKWFFVCHKREEIC